MERFLRWLNGNGRIARADADIMLARSDGAAARFYSMSTQIEAERTAYYEELESQQRGSLDVTAWIGWFLGCLERSFESASAHDDVQVREDRHLLPGLGPEGSSLHYSSNCIVSTPS